MGWEFIVLRIIAVLIGLRALTNVVKPFVAGSRVVFFGYLLGEPATRLVAPLVGFYMILYSILIWRGSRAALPMGIVYAVYATINVIMFPVLQGLPNGFSTTAYLAFGLVAVAVPWVAVRLLTRPNRDD